MLKATCLFFYLLGKWVLKLRFGAGSENVTVLGVCSAAGLVLDPLIIFKGKNMQYSWYGDKALPNTYYGKSKNGMNNRIEVSKILKNYLWMSLYFVNVHVFGLQHCLKIISFTDIFK